MKKIKVSIVITVMLFSFFGLRLDLNQSDNSLFRIGNMATAQSLDELLDNFGGMMDQWTGYRSVYSYDTSTGCLTTRTSTYEVRECISAFFYCDHGEEGFTIVDSVTTVDCAD